LLPSQLDRSQTQTKREIYPKQLDSRGQTPEALTGHAARPAPAPAASAFIHARQDTTLATTLTKQLGAIHRPLTPHPRGSTIVLSLSLPAGIAPGRRTPSRGSRRLSLDSEGRPEHATHTMAHRSSGERQDRPHAQSSISIPWWVEPTVDLASGSAAG